MRSKLEEWGDHHLHVTDYGITKYLETAQFERQRLAVSDLV
jgi:hypothetical protein